MLKKVAITGGLSCGKTTVGRIFGDLGAYVVSADEIVHRLMSPNTLLGSKLVSLLGDDVIVDGEFNRSKIAARVFADPVLLQSLQALIHPAVLNEIEKQYQQIVNEGTSSLFIAEIPLLFEVGADSRFDKTIAVWAPEEQCRQRFAASTGNSPDEYDRRMKFQLSPDEKKRRADYIIGNIGSKEQLKDEVKQLFVQLTTG